MRRPLTLSVAIVAALSLAGPALASPPYTVTYDTSTSGTARFTYTSTMPTTLKAKSSSGQITTVLDCAGQSGTGSVTAGPDRNPIFTVIPSSFSSCVTLGGKPSVHPSSLWGFRGGSAATTRNEVITGSLGSIGLGVESASNPSFCSFTVDGHAASSFDETTQTLTVKETSYGGALTLTRTSSGSCGGKLEPTSRASMTATLRISGVTIKAS